MNFVPGCLMRDEKNGKAWVEAAGGVRLPLGPNARGEQGRNVVYGIRPKSFTLAEPGAENGIELTIGVVQPTGDEIEVVTSIAGEPAIIVFTDRANFEPEQRITVCPMLDAVHLFDAETGTRISD
jgi:multiple sugar transport system ATP-binding protein